MTRLLSLVLLVACACAVEAHAQSGPLAAGTVTVDEPSVTCPRPSGAWAPGMPCAHATHNLPIIQRGPADRALLRLSDAIVPERNDRVLHQRRRNDARRPQSPNRSTRSNSTPLTITPPSAIR